MEDITLKEYIETRFTELEKRLCLKHIHQEYTLNTAKIELDRRLEGMNEFREQLSKQAATFLTRERFDIEHKILMDKINELINWKSEQIGKQNRANIISIIAVIVTLLGLIIHSFTKF